MLIHATVNELNNVLQAINPNYPKQKLSTIQSNKCFYILNETPVEIIIMKEPVSGKEKTNNGNR